MRFPYHLTSPRYREVQRLKERVADTNLDNNSRCAAGIMLMQKKDVEVTFEEWVTALDGIVYARFKIDGKDIVIGKKPTDGERGP